MDCIEEVWTLWGALNSVTDEDCMLIEQIFGLLKWFVCFVMGFSALRNLMWNHSVTGQCGLDAS